MNLKSIAVVDWLAAFYLIGTVLGLYFSPVLPRWFPFLVFPVLAAFAVSFRQKKTSLKFIFYFLILSFGLFRSIKASQSSSLQGLSSLRGYVADSPVLLERSQKFPLKTNFGTVLVTTDKYGTSFSYGESIEVSGDWRKVNRGLEARFPKITKLGGNQGNFLYNLTFSFREKFRKELTMILPEPEASLASGVLLGTHGITNKQFIENLRITGTSHIVSVSGFNISIIITGLIIALSFMSTTAVLLLLLPIVFVFDLMVGFTPPVLRATFMGLLLFAARMMGRQQNVTDALLISAAVIAAFTPLSLTSLSFQLSFLSTAGIVYLYPLISRLFDSWPAAIGGTLAATLSAQIAVLPITVYNFGTVSLISPLANLLVSFSIVPIMILSFLTGFLGQVLLPLGQIFGALDVVLLTYFVKIIDLLARIPWAAISL